MIVQPVLIRIPGAPGLSGAQWVERQRSYARRALEHCAKLSGAPRGEWPQSSERVPLPCEGWHWSIAHKPHFAAAVVSREPVGIDVESLAPRNSDLSAALASQEEWTLVQRGRGLKGADSSGGLHGWRMFFELWTAKEAALKSHGRGIGGLKSCRLQRIEKSGRFVLSFEGRDSAIEHFRYGDHVAACTCGTSRLTWHVIEGPQYL
jgi:phosphopantetheinyl transferase